MVRALVGAIGPGRVRLNTGVSEVTGGGPFVVRTSTGEAIDARAVVLATPAYVTSALTRDRDEALARLSAEIPYASAATVALAFRRSAITHPLNGSGFVVPRVEQQRHPRRVVAVVEVGAPRPGGSGSAAHVRRRRARS